MGKSGRKKKSGHSTAESTSAATSSSASSPSASPAPLPQAAAQPNDVGSESAAFLKQAHDLKDEGNRRFQAKDYAAALEQYERALMLLPRGHPERAVFHSNRAACLLQMRPVDHEAVAAECSLALQVQPRFTRALFRRARALEALRRYDLAFQDVNSLLAVEPAHPDALELACRLRAALSPSRSHNPDQSHCSHPSPAALGASAIRSVAPISGLGPCLPSRPAPKKPTSPPAPQKSTSEKDKPVAAALLPNGLQAKGVSSPLVSLKPAAKMDTEKKISLDAAGKATTRTRWRPLKLIYDHDIRLAEMPMNCSLKILREIVAKRFPSSKSVLIKYKDLDGDLVTVTRTEELRLAESCADDLCRKKRNEGDGLVEEKLEVLRLHVVEVSPEQEPSIPIEEQDKNAEEGPAKADASLSPLVGDSPSPAGIVAEEKIVKEKAQKDCDHTECKVVECDDWIYEFAQLFHQQVGIDPDVHLDLHELGMELCSEALEEVVTSEEAQDLFEMAAAKFQEVAALAFFNWGNVHMCAARKRTPLDETLQKEVLAARLQEAYDWVKDKYTLAGQKYEAALQVKPDFYEGMLALGQQHFETAKLHWSFALANKVDLTTWDSSETINLFNSAEEKMKAATALWEKVEEQRINELKDPGSNKKNELLKRRKKQGMLVDGQGELSVEEVAEQATVMRSQIHLFWGNMLFERSQVEFKLGFDDWKKTLDGAVERFKLAGASEADISAVLKNHSSNSTALVCEEKNRASPSDDNSKMSPKSQDMNLEES
ncbi:hypothetical protein HPP92_019455 [Vanilla planifolia]|uniref:PB1 domain-containing protein n=1 Tax=Vanilla planifolia TaxID=51239 RepID=A0A835Q2W5_VANPL|nr:hypothetical protein HPP92_019455 [Vanilla planifolia]